MLNTTPNLFATLLAMISLVSCQEFLGQLNEYQSKEPIISGGISTSFEGNVDTSKIFGQFQGGEPVGDGPINIAVRRTHSVSTVPVNVPDSDFVPQVIEVDAGELPIVLKFNSRSSRVQVTQSHIGGGGGQVEQTSSEDAPTRLVHEVTKPIIQEVREVITPFRRVIQEIRPVVEEVHTVVARGPPPKPAPPKPRPPPSPTGKLGVSKGTGIKGPGVKGDGGVSGTLSVGASLSSSLEGVGGIESFGSKAKSSYIGSRSYN